jgi:hypothetical protein
MSLQESAVKLTPVVRFREFSFGSLTDPSMREFMTPAPWEHQEDALAYLRSGQILAYPMGADLGDCFDRPHRANPLIEGRRLGGATPMTDGVWFWYAGLIHFIEKYNVRLPQEFLDHAVGQGWRVKREAIAAGPYEFSYFSTPAS